MHIDEYERMYRWEEHYWWFVGRRELILRLLKPRLSEISAPLILDAGCGTGAVTKALEAFGEVTGADFSARALSYSRKRGCPQLVQSRVEQLPFADHSFHAITALDIVEHVEADTCALQEFWRVLKPGGWLAMSVPAYQFLWSGHDDALMHKRRYTRQELRQRLQETGFEIPKISYAVTCLFLPILMFRLKDRWFGRKREPEASIVPVPDWLNRTLIAIQRLEGTFLEKVNLPYGVSVIALAQKRK